MWTIVAVETMMSSRRFGCYLEPLLSWKVAALTSGEYKTEWGVGVGGGVEWEIRVGRCSRGCRRGGREFIWEYACRKDCDGHDREGITCYLACTCTWYALVHYAYHISICTSWWQSLLYCIGDLCQSSSPSLSPVPSKTIVQTHSHCTPPFTCLCLQPHYPHTLLANGHEVCTPHLVEWPNTHTWLITKTQCGRELWESK